MVRAGTVDPSQPEEEVFSILCRPIWQDGAVKARIAAVASTSQSVYLGLDEIQGIEGELESRKLKN